ncbi:hypothetical protein [Curtobacterium sp. BRB10]|uniref:hypothetical protein n=1 Tax=Curtobacterium sp. BRB10 TaxID=2962579 RepID=UPI002881421C|nr:hypothetical protein [Curtobacterium sp. BRB10]MDT0234792.1 hypothetical protein [Curtobacterium sp. BRB10]
MVVGDDRDRFGQRVTGSGTVTYTDVHVPDERVLPYATRYPYQEQYYRTFMHAVLVGIGRAALRDGVAALRVRARGHRNGTADRPTTRNSSAWWAPSPRRCERRTPRSPRALGRSTPVDRHTALRVAGADPAGDSVLRDLLERSWTAVAQTQTVVTDAVLDATTVVFDALGSSGTFLSLGLDRHWRNARTLASHSPRVHKRRLVGDLLMNGASTLDR